MLLGKHKSLSGFPDSKEVECQSMTNLTLGHPSTARTDENFGNLQTTTNRPKRSIPDH